MIEQVLMAIIETVGSHPDFNGPLSEALQRRGVSLEAPAFHVCRNVGTAYTTPTFLLRGADGMWEARAGIAIMGSTNMSEDDLERLSPFDKDFHDNYASGVGETPAVAVAVMHKDRESIADSIWAG